MKNVNYLVLAVLSIVFVSGCVTGPCTISGYSEAESINKSISNFEEALIGIKDYLASINSSSKLLRDATINDIEYKEITVSFWEDIITGTHNPTEIEAWTLKEELAIDKNGTVYARGGCG